MRIYTNFIIMYEDMKLPDATQFCPFMWQKEGFDADGDYYYDNQEGKWSQLSIYINEPDDENSKTILNVNTHREHNKYEHPIMEVNDLQRYIDYHKAGRYEYDEDMARLNNLAITSLEFWTDYTIYYEEFLKTTLSFLEHTKGFIVNMNDINAQEFKAEFLEN